MGISQQACKSCFRLRIVVVCAGIFGYLNYMTPRTRLYILECLIKGLQRLEYRGYDSAGVAFDVDDTNDQGANKIRCAYNALLFIVYYPL